LEAFDHRLHRSTGAGQKLDGAAWGRWAAVTISLGNVGHWADRWPFVVGMGRSARLVAPSCRAAWTADRSNAPIAASVQ